jgi:hypothetical protein
MTIDPADLIRRFEPILFFHQDERFFPSDAKRYIEHSALWSVNSAIRDNKGFWGGLTTRTLPHFPDIARDQIAAAADELGAASENRVFLGSGSVDLSETATLEHFLDMAGWTDSGRVDFDTDNSFAALNSISINYQFDEDISASRFWYHAEIFDAERLRAIVAGKPKLVSDFFFKLQDPLLLCYYLFFPAHEEPLEGCGAAEFQRSWGSYAGEWACVALLLEGDGNQADYQPTHVGLTSRNAGTVMFLGQEMRIGMRVVSIDNLTKVTRPRPADSQGRPRADGEHIRIFVSKGTHGLYEMGGPQPVPSFSPSDPVGLSCGRFETSSSLADDINSHVASIDRRQQTMVIKSIIGGLGELGASIVGSGFNPIPVVVGAFAGYDLGLLEGTIAYGGYGEFEGDEPPLVATPPQFDHAPTLSEIKTVIGPPDVAIPDAPDDSREAWPRFTSDESVLSTTINSRQYSLFVGKPDDLSSRPAWLASGTMTFQGRWGNRVQHDPFNRRAGMKFPDFAGMFFDGLGM